MSPSAPSPWFAQAKIQPPHPRAATLVARPALEAGLVEHLMAQRVVLLHAAAGFGKSLLLARAVERLPGTCARVWLSLDEGDTLRSAGECLATALEPFDPPWRADPMSLAGAGEVHAAAAVFANTLLALETQRGVLVLDDLHRVQDPGLVQFFAVLVERLTPGWCVAIASRTSLRGMAMVLRGWLQLRGGDGPGASTTCAEARSECLWLNQPEALAFQLGLLQAQLLAQDERPDALDQHLRAMLEHASKAQDRQHRSASTGLLLYLGTRFASQSGHAALALELGQRLLKDADTVAGWIRADALSGIQAIVHECQGAAAPALAHWRQQLAMEGRSDLFGQAAEARLHGAALSATLEGRPQALALLTPLLQRCAAEGEPGLLRLASPSARQQLARHGLLAPLPPAAAAGSVEAAAPVSAFAAAGLSSRELDVLSRLAAGHSNKLIAREFTVSPFTVKRHVGNILNKLDLASRGQAAAWYRDHGGR
jgi:DNA-binding CsgD family transcriptional regulator